MVKPTRRKGKVHPAVLIHPDSFVLAARTQASLENLLESGSLCTASIRPEPLRARVREALDILDQYEGAVEAIREWLDENHPELGEVP